MSKLYLIQYQKGTDNIIENRIKSLSPNWIKYFEDNFLIESDLGPEEIYNTIVTGTNEISILIIEISNNNYYGRMKTNLWEWLKERKRRNSQ